MSRVKEDSLDVSIYPIENGWIVLAWLDGEDKPKRFYCDSPDTVVAKIKDLMAGFDWDE
jgi:hypothetical protein